MSEWLVHDYAREGRTAGLARLTHVVDNAVVMQKVDESASRPDGVMRLHDPDVFFYARSAIESSQLLLLAGLQPEPGLRALAIRELGDPVDWCGWCSAGCATGARARPGHLLLRLR